MPLHTTPSRTCGRLLLALVACAACGADEDRGVIVEPRLGLTVAVATNWVSSPTIGTDAELSQTIACDVSLRATAEGIGTATWQEGTLYWFAGVDRTLPLDSTPLPAATVRESWGADRIAAGDVQEARWQVLAYAPFALGAAFRYREGSDDQTRIAKTTFTCGPDVPAGGVAPPALSLAAVRLPPGPVEPGDTLAVEYTAASTVGLWETRVSVQGPCTTIATFGEPLVRSVTRTVPVVLPAECALGVPVTVVVAAADAALQERSQRLTPGFTLTDVTPPAIGIMSLPATGGSLITGVAGTYFAADSVVFRFGASDNHELRALIWEVLPHGFRDSLLVSGSAAEPWIPLTLRPEWAGPIELRFSARDAAGNVSAPLVTRPGDVRVLPTRNPPAVDTTVPGAAGELVIDMARGTLYLLQPAQRHIRVMATATLATVEIIPMPGAGLDMDLTPGGDSLMLTLPELRALGVVDLRAAARAVTVVPLTSLDSTLDQMPAFLRTLANGRAFVRLGGGNPDGWTLLELNLATGAETTRADAGVSGNVGAAVLERSQDYTAVVLAMPGTEFQKYQMGQDAFGPRRTAAVGGPPSLDRDGQRVAVSRYVYDGSLLPVREVESMFPPGTSIFEPSALTPSGDYLYHALYPWGVLRSRISDGALVDRIPTPLAPTDLRFSADGTMLVEVQETYAGTVRVRVVDLRQE